MRKESKNSFKPFSMRSAPILVWGIKALEKTSSKGLRGRKSVQKNVGQGKKNLTAKVFFVLTAKKR